MYIKKRVLPSSPGKKQKTLYNLISIIQNSISTPRNYSMIYNQFFEILNKVIAIQLKLIDDTTTESNLSMTKYKKYLETKIGSFFQSIRPLSPTLAEKGYQLKTPKKTTSTLSCCIHNSNNDSLTEGISYGINTTNNKRHISGKSMPKNHSLSHIFKKPFQLPTSNKLKSVIGSYLDRYEEEENNKYNNKNAHFNTIHHTNTITSSVKSQNNCITSPNGIHSQQQQLIINDHCVNRSKIKKLVKNYSQTDIHQYNKNKLLMSYKDTCINNNNNKSQLNHHNIQ